MTPSVEMSAPPVLPRVFVAVPITQSEIDEWRDLGCEVVANAHLNSATLIAALRDINPLVLVTHGLEVNTESLRAAKQLALVIHRGTGCDGIDLAAATSLGIQVANCPGVDAPTVAEHAFGLLLAADRTIGVSASSRTEALGLRGRTLGIVGFGAVGREVSRRAIAFGMRVMAWNDPPVDSAFSEMGIHPCEAIINVARLCDMVVVCVPERDARAGIVNARFIAAVHKNAVLVDTSAPGVVDADALSQRLRARDLFVGKDRFRDDAERLAFASLPGTVCTPNTARRSAETDLGYRSAVQRILGTFLRTGRASGLLNPATPHTAKHVLLVRHRNEPGVLAHTLTTLGAAGINVDDVDNVNLAESRTGVATMHISHAPSATVLELIQSDARILGVCSLPGFKKHR